MQLSQIHEHCIKKNSTKNKAKQQNESKFNPKFKRYIQFIR